MRVSVWSSDVCSSDVGARDIDQRGLADHGGRGDHFGGEQKGKRAGAADEFRPDEAHHRLAWDAERKRDARLGGDDPESDLAHLLRYGDEALFGNIAGDDRTEDRLESSEERRVGEEGVRKCRIRGSPYH